MPFDRSMPVLLLTALLAGCGRESKAAWTTPDERPRDAGAATKAASSSSAETTTSGDVYDPDVIPRFELTLDAAALEVLSSPAEADKKKWVHGTFKYGATVLEGVGVRRKGSSTFRVLPKKVALKVKFNKYKAHQRFQGLTQLTLNNQISDPTFLEERLGYYVYRSMGLPAQRANEARVFINGEDYGLHANVETPDKDFLSRAFGGRGKTLYEQRWGSQWTPGAESGFEVKVGPKDKADLSRLFRAVASARSTSLLGDVSSRLDTNRFLDHCAVEAVIGDIDAYGFATWGSGNYFLVGDAEGSFSMVPWSLDQSFNDRAGVVDANNPLPADPTNGGATLLTRCKQSSACWSAYASHVQAVLAKYESLDLVRVATRWHAQIDELALADPKKEYSNSAYGAETSALYRWLAARPALVRKQLGLPRP